MTLESTHPPAFHLLSTSLTKRVHMQSKYSSRIGLMSLAVMQLELFVLFYVVYELQSCCILSAMKETPVLHLLISLM